MDGVSFKLFRIPVTIEPSFLFVAVVGGFAGRSLTYFAIWVPVLCLSVLAHELGHGIACRAFGQQPRIVLQGIVGLTYHSGPLTWPKQIIISLAGPMTDLAIGAPALLYQHSVGHVASPWATALRIVVYVNIVWSMLNLLPIVPLDGGQVVTALLHRAKGATGEQAALVVSMLVAGATAIVGLRLNVPVVALLALLLMALNGRSFSRARKWAPLTAGYDALNRNEMAAAASKADKVLTSAPPGDLAARAVELKAWVAFCSMGGALAASAALAAMPAGEATNSFLLGSLALAAGRKVAALDHYAGAFSAGQFGPWNTMVAMAVVRFDLVGELADRLAAIPGTGAGAGALVAFQSHLRSAGSFSEAALIGERAFEADPEESALVAFDVARSLARTGAADRALDWLERAATIGLEAPGRLDSDPDLVSLRNSARYQGIRAQAGNFAVPPTPTAWPLTDF